MSDYNSSKTTVNANDGFAENPGSDVVISNNDKDSTDLVSAYELNTETETRVAAPEVVNEGIDPNEQFPGIHKNIKTAAPAEDEVKEERVASAAKEEPKEEVKADSEVPTGTTKDVLAWVGNDPEKAKLALAAEEKGEKRSTLITKLNEVK